MPEWARSGLLPLGFKPTIHLSHLTITQMLLGQDKELSLDRPVQSPEQLGGGLAPALREGPEREEDGR